MRGALILLAQLPLNSIRCWMTAKHRDTKGVNVIMFYSFHPPSSSASFNFILLFSFQLYNCALSAYCFRYISCESIRIGVWLLFDFVRNSQKFWTETTLVFALSSSSYEREYSCQIAKWIFAALHYITSHVHIDYCVYTQSHQRASYHSLSLHIEWTFCDVAYAYDYTTDGWEQDMCSCIAVALRCLPRLFVIRR